MFTASKRNCISFFAKYTYKFYESILVNLLIYYDAIYEA